MSNIKKASVFVCLVLALSSANATTITCTPETQATRSAAGVHFSSKNNKEILQLFVTLWTKNDLSELHNLIAPIMNKMVNPSGNYQGKLSGSCLYTYLTTYPDCSDRVIRAIANSGNHDSYQRYYQEAVTKCPTDISFTQP